MLPKKKKPYKKAYTIYSSDSFLKMSQKRLVCFFFSPSLHLLDAEADRVSHISLQHVFCVSLFCESAKRSIHPGCVPGLLGKPDFQPALYATVKII